MNYIPVEQIFENWSQARNELNKYIQKIHYDPNYGFFRAEILDRSIKISYKIPYIFYKNSNLLNKEFIFPSDIRYKLEEIINDVIIKFTPELSYFIYSQILEHSEDFILNEIKEYGEKINRETGRDIIDEFKLKLGLIY